MIQETYPMMVGDMEVLNERILLTQVENGLLMNGADSVRFIVIHCSATRCDRDYTVEQLLRDHKARGFNRCSIGICHERGLDEYGNPADTRTPIQKAALLELLYKLYKLFPQALIVGHGELPGVKKDCPCFSCDGYRYRFH